MEIKSKKFKGVYYIKAKGSFEKGESIPAREYWLARRKINGKVVWRQEGKDERDAAKLYDIRLIQEGKRPVNILSRPGTNKKDMKPMRFFCYLPTLTGDEPLNISNKHVFTADNWKEAKKHCIRNHGARYRLFQFTNFFDRSTFKRVM